jgi:hypothetical protein
MEIMCRDYIQRAGDLSREPDAYLLAPIAAVFESLQSPDNASR